MTESAPKLTLTYYKFSASAETFRLAAAIGKIRFTNKAIEKDAWEPPPGKHGDPRYELPILEIEVKGQETQVISNRNAILHYLGRRGGLYPTDPLEGLQIEYMLDTVSEALRPLEMSNDGIVPALLSDKPLSEEQLLKIREGIAKDSEFGLPKYLQFFEKSLRENYENKASKWLVGTDVSIADLKLYQLVCWIGGGVGDGDGPSLLKGIDASLIESYTHLLKHKMQIETLPEVMSWRAKYTPPYSIFEHRPPYEFRSIGRRSRLGNHHDPMTPAVGRMNPNMGANAARSRAASVPRLTLTYFETAGRAEPIRLAAAMGKIPFTNRTMSREDWPEMKRFSPLKHLPTLTVVEPGKDLVTAPQSTAILRYIGKLGGLYPADEIEAVQLEFFMQTISHALRLIEMTTTGVAKALILDVLFTEEERLQIQKRIMSDRKRGLPFYLGYFESILETKKEHEFLIGNSVTIADLALYHLSSSVAGSSDMHDSTSDSPLLQEFPLIRQHKELIEKNPLVIRFRARYKPPYSTFDFIPGQDEAENFEKKSRDGLPRMVRRRNSSGAFPKNVSRSKSTDSVPTAAARRPGFGAPTPVKRRTSVEDDPKVDKSTHSKDKMMAPPLRRKPSFEDDVNTEAEDQRRRGSSLPPRPRPVNIIDDDEEEDDCFSFSEGSSDSDGFDVGAITRPQTRVQHDEFEDNSSTESFEVESSISSADLILLKRRLQSSSETEVGGTAPKHSAPFNWTAKREEEEKEMGLRSSAKGSPPKLPANIPRNRPSLNASKKRPTKPKKETKKAAEQPKAKESGSSHSKSEEANGPMYKWAAKDVEKKDAEASPKPEKEAKNSQHSSKETDGPMYKWTEMDKEENVKNDADGTSRKKSSTPKGPRTTRRVPSGSPRTKKFPSNNPRGSGQLPQISVGNKQEDLVAKLEDTEKAVDSKGRSGSFTDDAKLALAMQKSSSFSSERKRVLVYFSIPGRAESIRLAAVVARLPFTNVSINPEERDPALKHIAPLGQFPVLEIEEAHNRRLTVPQSMAILRYVGMLGGLYPRDPLDALAVDSMCDFVDDALRLIETTCRSSSRSILGFKAFSDEECVDMRKRMADDESNGIRSFLVFFERVLERNFSKFGVWIAHKEITIADLRLYQLHMWLGGKFGACLNGDRLDGIPDDILSGFPLLDLHRERVEEIADVMAFRSRFSWPYSTFYFNPGEAADEEGACAFLVEDVSKGPRLTLTHANKTVHVEPIRFAAVIGKLPFTNKVVEADSEEWKNIYERRFTVSQLPLLEIENPGLDKKFVTQPIAILRYICKLGNLYPTNPIRALEVESMIETILEIQKLVNIPMDDVLQTFMSGSPWSENELWSVRRRIAKNNEQGLPYYLAYFEKAIMENPGSSWLIGPTITIADLCLYDLLQFITRSSSGEDHDHKQWDGFPDIIMDFPMLKNHMTEIESLPAVASFRSKFQPPYQTFAFRPTV